MRDFTPALQPRTRDLCGNRRVGKARVSSPDPRGNPGETRQWWERPKATNPVISGAETDKGDKVGLNGGVDFLPDYLGLAGSTAVREGASMLVKKYTVCCVGC